MAATYYASVRESAVGANKRHLAVWNGAGSGKTMVVYRIVAVGSPTAVVAGMKVALASMRVTTAPTGGTVLGIAKAKPTSPDVPVEVEVRAVPTAGGTPEPIAFGLGSVSGEETASDNESVLYKAPDDPSAAGGAEAVEFPEGTGFEVRQGTLAGAGAVSLIAEFGLIPIPGAG